MRVRAPVGCKKPPAWRASEFFGPRLWGVRNYASTARYREAMLSAIRSLLRQIAAISGGLSAHCRCRALVLEQFESRSLLASVTLTPVADNTMFQDQTSHADGAGPTMFAGETL